MADLFDPIFGPRRGHKGAGAAQGIPQRVLNKVVGMARGDTCFLCEVGSRRVVLAAGQRSVRSDAVGTCSACHVHACPQHGDRYTRTFKCADCLAAVGAARTLGGEPGSVEGVRPPDDPDASQAAAFGARRLLAANDAYVTAHDASRLSRGVTGGGRTFEVRLRREVEEIPTSELWKALAVPAPPAHQNRYPEEDLVFNPDDARRLAVGRVSLLERVASGLAGRFADFSQDVDWNELAIFTALPVVGRGGRIGESVLRISGGLTLPPIIAVLAQAHADAGLD